MSRPSALFMSAAVLLAAAPAGAAVAAHDSATETGPRPELRLPRIKGNVGPGMTISVSRHNAPPGRYRFVITDQSSSHNWHIRGPGVDRRTSVAGTGRTVWRLRLTAGTYRIKCDPHASTMHTRLVVS